MHVHQFVTDAGVSEIRISDHDHDLLWLQRQRLISTAVVVNYAGYTPFTRDSHTDDPGSPERPAVAYVGYMYEDTSGCPVCRGV